MAKTSKIDLSDPSIRANAERFQTFRKRVLRALNYRAGSSATPDIVDDTIETVARLMGARAADLSDDDVTQLLIRSAINRARSYAREEIARKNREVAYADVHEPPPSDTSKIDTKLAVHAVLAELTPEDAELIWKVYCTQEWTVQDAADNRGCSVRAMFRVLASLRDLLRVRLAEVGAAFSGQDTVERRPADVVPLLSDES